MDPTTPPTFATLGLAPALSEALAVQGFSSMTPVQAQALPPLLAGRDVIAQARTGSGKTVAFGLALLARVDVDVARAQALVLCPTRELADQVGEALRRLARFVPNLRVVTLCGGVPVRSQVLSLQTPPHVVVGTPGRVLDHLARDTLSFDALRVLVLDEADRMLDMGFHEAIASVVERVPPRRQTMLFSATWPDAIRALSRTLQKDPVDVTVDDTAAAAADLDEVFYSVEPADKPATLAALLLHHRPASALVFCQTKNDVKDVTADLARRGFAALALHGDLEQRERDEVIVRFAHKSCAVLVATDVAARGLDVKDLSAVVSYELPHDVDTHTHRTGRTGRAGKKGLAWALVAPRERGRATNLADVSGRVLRFEPLPPLTDERPSPAPMTTLVVDGGKRDKLRPGDLLGALTGDVGLPGDAVGRIDIGLRRTWVAVRREHADAALRGLREGRIKAKTFRVETLG